jgi:2-succinyl-5-enolpyruvyl-6-hydroxy-3-cyclohexene-1-carboxylate synthase
LEVLEQALARHSDSISEPTPFLNQASTLDSQLFSEIFSDLQDRLKQGELTKGVPYLFEKTEQSVSPLHRLRYLVNLLRKTQGQPLQVYGIWDSQEGILGATPEILFSQSGDQFETVALAGTRLHGEPAHSVNSLAVSPLMDDPKERLEHQIVVDGISGALRTSLGDELVDLQVGQLHELQLPSLTHLCTPVSFRLKENQGTGSDLFGRVVRTLHPTPALGAFPKEVGSEWLARIQKKIPRGRFGAPFGAVFGESVLGELNETQRLQGHCLVAIRNLQWDQQGTRMGAGCGVVPASQLDREWGEIQGKIKAIQSWFGLERIDSAHPARVAPVEGSNLKLAQSVLEEIDRRGVREICVCPGARNAPWVVLLASNPNLFQVYYHFEERSAAFFALGRIRQTGRPMAVITTSGTAAGELLPATMEAYYSGLPLFLLTADRPRHYRGSGAPQAAEQVGIFGVYAPHVFDLEASSSRMSLVREGLAQLDLTQPVHLNVCFDEPLIDGPIPQLSFGQVESVSLGERLGPGVGAGPPNEWIPVEVQSFFASVQWPLILVGMLSPNERESVAQVLLRLKCPTYLEATSGLREDPRLQGFRVRIADGILERLQKSRPDGRLACDGVMRLGGVPTPRIWRDLEGQLRSLQVLSLSSLPFSGLGRPSFLWRGSLGNSCECLLQELDRCGWRAPESHFEAFLELDRQAADDLALNLAQSPLSQRGMISRLSRLIPRGSRVYLGNSAPIRDWDLASTSESRELEVWASRGVNGIDGQVSSFLGFAAACNPSEAQNWAILGDLTSLYDLAGPWILSQLKQTSVNLVVINNGGGKIFSGMFKQKEFQNQHEIQFRAWADLWNLDYLLWKEVPEAPGGATGESLNDFSWWRQGRSRVIEIQPSMSEVR